MDCEIRLDHIAIPPGRRTVDPDAVTNLKKSIAVLGLQYRVTVRKRDDAYVLVAGAHRLEAFRQLGKERIPATVVDFDEFQAELFEIAENLVRNQLSPAQQAAAFARQKVNYEELHPETKHGAIGKGRVINGAVKAERYTKLAADATGISEAAVQRWVHRGETLGQELLGKIVGTSLDVGTELDGLIKLPAAELLILVDRAMAGEAVSAVKAQAAQFPVAERQALVDRAAAGENATAQPPTKPAAAAGALKAPPIDGGAARVVDKVEDKAPARPAASTEVESGAQPMASDDPDEVLRLANALLAQADGLLNSWQKLYERNDDAVAEDGKLAKAFIVQADIAIAAASYLVGPVTRDVVEKAQDVISEWQNFLQELEAEGPILDEDAA
jgi:hypothetical protein